MTIKRPPQHRPARRHDLNNDRDRCTLLRQRVAPVTDDNNKRIHMNGQEWAEILVPFIVFSALVALIALFLLYKYKKKKLFLQMVERAIQRQAPLTPEVIREVANHFFTANQDLRKGIFLLVTALSILAFSQLAEFRKNGNLDLNDALNGIAILPGLLGLAFLLLARLERDRGR